MITWSGKIKDFLEFIENEEKAYPNLCDSKKAMLRRKVIVLSTFIKNLERSYTRNFKAHLKSLEQKKQTHQRGVDGGK